MYEYNVQYNKTYITLHYSIFCERVTGQSKSFASFNKS